jgi:hypothetical protein
VGKKAKARDKSQTQNVLNIDSYVFILGRNGPFSNLNESMTSTHQRLTMYTGTLIAAVEPWLLLFVPML